MLAVILIWGANISIAKAALAAIPPVPFTIVRFALATAALAGLLRAREGAPRVSRRMWWKLIGLGLLGNTLYQCLFIIGLSRTTAANSAMLMAITPVLVTLAGGLLGLERITRNMAAGAALAFAGVAVVMLARGAALSAQTFVGDALTLAAAGCWAVYVLGWRTLGAEISSLAATTLSMFAGMLGLLVIGGPQLLQVDWLTLPLRAWVGLLYSALLALVVAHVLYNRNVKLIGGARTTIYGCAIPLVAMLLAWPVLGERPSWWQGVGAALIISGVLLSRLMNKEA